MHHFYGDKKLFSQDSDATNIQSDDLEAVLCALPCQTICILNSPITVHSSHSHRKEKALLCCERLLFMALAVSTCLVVVFGSALLRIHTIFRVCPLVITA